MDSSLGRAFLAYLPEPLTRPILCAQQRRKETSELPADRLAAILAEVRRTGVATARGSVIAGLHVISAPVFGPGGSVELVIGVAMPARIDGERDIRRITDELLATAKAISTELGSSEQAVTAR